MFENLARDTVVTLVREMVRQFLASCLGPFLYIPTTLAVSQSLGRRPSLRDFQNISVKMGANSQLHSLSTVFGIISGPLALFILASARLALGLKFV